MAKRMLFLLLVICCLAARGQFLFSNLKPSDGLSSRETRAVFRDSEGFVWIGTNNGLNRFDGNSFKVWNKISPGYSPVLGEVITTIREHRKRIWFGTNAGIGILDKNSNGMSEVLTKEVYKGNRLAVTKLEHDGYGRIWAATSRGLFIEQDEQLVPVSRLYPFARELDTLAFLHASFVFDAGRNCFWIGSTSGSFCLDLHKKHLFSSGNPAGQNPFFTKDVINAIALDAKGNLWFSNQTRSLLFYYDEERQHSDSIAAINNNPDWKFYGGCNALFFDRQGRLWISTWLYSVFVRQPDGRFHIVAYKRDDPFSIGYGFFHDAFEDAYGNVWFATINGLSKITANSFVEAIVRAPSYRSFLPVAFGNVNRIALDNNGDWWLGKMEGLVHYNTFTRQFSHYILSAGDLRANEIFDLKWIGKEWWCATNHGIQIFNPATKKFRPFEHNPAKKGKNQWVIWIYQDRQGVIWSSVWREGIYRFDPSTKQTILINDKEGWGDMQAKNSLCVFEAPDGKLWISAGEEGVRIFDPAKQRFEKPVSPLLQSEVVASVTADVTGNIWMSTARHGLIKANGVGRVLDSVTRANGLPANRLDNLCIDPSGKIWAISREHIICVSPSSHEVTAVDIRANFSFNDHWNTLIRKGHLLYGAMLDNVVVINTERYQQVARPVRPLLSGFSVFGKEKPIQPMQAIRLGYKENFFSIDFASPIHREALSMQYAYKLDGFDKDWVYCGRKLNATYTNVPDGQYTFRVKTTDGKGRWMDNVASVPVVVAPPFWKRRWFIALVSVFSLLNMAWLYHTARRQQQKKSIDDTIDYFANSVYGANSLTEICWDIARNCIARLRFEDCVVYLLDMERGVLVQKAAHGPKNPKGHEISNPIEIPLGRGIVGTVAATGRPLLVGDTTRDSRYIIDDELRYSELSVPILHEGKVIGVIDSEHRKKNFFRQEHLKAVSTIASISSNKIAEALAEAKAREKEIQLLEIQKLLAESQLMSLRAQMNPHFVFNCLNSIQECIVTRKYGDASHYLNKFSKLFRTVLNNSGKNLVTLNEEKEVLQLYLELEHMRFEKSFAYTVRVDEELDMDEIPIPSMLLQPFVENALWHGLMHKHGDRCLLLQFKYLSDEVYQCIIEDNGIGR
jgi:ligand-binding sensor domain-containing protein/putative methionine-R-sulfoxide reductase with GAF domain